MSVGPLLVALGASALGALAALADGALLALDPHAPLETSVAALRDRRERAHRAIAFARLAAQLVAGIAVALAFELTQRSLAAAAVIGLAMALLLAGLSESLARAVGDSLAARAVKALAGYIGFIELVFAPLVSLGAALDRALMRLLPPPSLAEEDRDEAAEQFMQVVAAEANVTKEQEVLLGGVFALKDTTVHEIMVPRVEVIAVPRDATWAEVIDRVRSSEHARLPVYSVSVDNVVGILYAKDLLPAVVADEEPEQGWLHLVRPASFIPATKTADAQLRDFQASGTHMAIVVDEFGGTAGLLTIEDVLEEIVGEIHDEYDEEEAPVVQENGDRYWISARLTLDELSDLLGVDMRREGVSTAGGLVYELLGRVPGAGERFKHRGYTWVVERVVRRRVKRIFLERAP
ncbi:MAG: hemolysin family protein [Gemmatimonadaceae bacterium]